jgi:hypothetical protein
MRRTHYEVSPSTQKNGLITFSVKSHIDYDTALSTMS